MLTYQDFLQIPESDVDRAAFVYRVINDYKTGTFYSIASIADDYERCRNTTITSYQKTITTVTGEVVPDHFATTHRSACNFFNIFVTQVSQYLLGNGVNWENSDPANLGDDFDTQFQKAGRLALSGGASYVFFNLDHVNVFSALEFVPLYDEEDGSIKAGIRFWQIDKDKPLRATLYELDGYTNYLWFNDYTNPSDIWDQVSTGVYMQPKRPYVLHIRTSEADGTEIYDGDNYPTFPIIPFWGNPYHHSEIVGLREKIDAYDFLMNGFEDDLDNAQLYWIIKGAGGMDDPDLEQFLERLKTVKAAAPADGQDVVPVAVNIPYEAREKLLDRVERQLYKDAMLLDPESIASGAATATQIKAAYEPQNNKTDQFEYCALECLHNIMNVAGIDDNPSFTRSVIVNTQEEITTVVAAASYLDQEYVTKKILTLLGDADQIEEVLKRKDEEDAERLNVGDTPDKPREGSPEASDVEDGQE